MAINGINSYGMGYYNYQSSINNVRLAQALSKNQRFNQYAAMSASPWGNPSSFKSSMNFVKDYTNSMSSLMSAASELKTSNAAGAMRDLSVTSSDESIATAKERFSLRDVKEMTLRVDQLAQAQTNTSDSVKASDKAQADMNFTVSSLTGTTDVKVSSLNKDGSAKSNYQMLREAADQINGSDSGVKASLVQKDGNVSLELSGKETGTMSAFSVSGELGAASGLDAVGTEAANAKYSVKADGKTTNYESQSNNVNVDFTRIGVELKGVGETTISADVDVDKVSSALSDLVGAYNSSLKLLNDNYDRGTGVDKQLRNLVMGLGSEQSLEKLGITVNKDATLKFDKDVLAKSMKEDPSFTKNLISGVADKAFNKGVTGIHANSSSLINGDMAGAESSYATNPMNMFNSYSRSSVHAMNNYAAVGMMLNYLI